MITTRRQSSLANNGHSNQKSHSSLTSTLSSYLPYYLSWNKARTTPEALPPPPDVAYSLTEKQRMSLKHKSNGGSYQPPTGQRRGISRHRDSLTLLTGQLLPVLAGSPSQDHQRLEQISRDH